MIQINLFIKLKYTNRHSKPIYGFQKGKRTGNKLGVWD